MPQLIPHNVMLKHRSISILIPRIPINRLIQEDGAKRKPPIHGGAVESVVLPFTPAVERLHGSDVLVQVIPDLLGDVNECMSKLRNESD